ncbi:hypothetical protein VTK26DRAFT_5166 [Humicola hyalothermophila]
MLAELGSTASHFFLFSVNAGMPRSRHSIIADSVSISAWPLRLFSIQLRCSTAQAKGKGCEQANDTQTWLRLSLNVSMTVPAGSDATNTVILMYHVYLDLGGHGIPLFLCLGLFFMFLLDKNTVEGERTNLTIRGLSPSYVPVFILFLFSVSGPSSTECESHCA